jgi:hypothetical protein
MNTAYPKITRDNIERIERALQSETSCSFKDKPLEEAIRYFGTRHRIETWLDKQALQDEGVATDQQVTLQFSAVSLEVALAYTLEPLGLDYVVDDGILKVTTMAKSDEKMSTRIYPVGDLLNSSYAPLTTMIMNNTGGKWYEIDQEGGTITPFRNSRSLIIRNTRRVHREIEGVLTSLREAKHLKISATSAKSPSIQATKPIHKPTISKHSTFNLRPTIPTAPHSQPMTLFSAGG